MQQPTGSPETPEFTEIPKPRQRKMFVICETCARGIAANERENHRVECEKWGYTREADRRRIRNILVKYMSVSKAYFVAKLLIT